MPCIWSSVISRILLLLNSHSNTLQTPNLPPQCSGDHPKQTVTLRNRILAASASSSANTSPAIVSTFPSAALQPAGWPHVSKSAGSRPQISRQAVGDQSSGEDPPRLRLALGLMCCLLIPVFVGDAWPSREDDIDIVPVSSVREPI